MTAKEKVLLFLLLVLPVFLVVSLYSLDKEYVANPVQNKGYLLVRSDARGDGYFASKRNGRKLHNGIDLYAALGAPVVAARSGIVVAATHNRGMGDYIIIKHADGLTTIYGHLSEIAVLKGQHVRQKDGIGRVGKTGNANFRDIQPHLHFEIRKNEVPQDPLEYF